jgi:hypothetical protein
MIDDVKEILSKSVEDVINSALSSKLLKCYSQLYKNGNLVHGCKSSQRNYYHQLTKNGIEMAEKYESSKLRTCKPAWNGLKYLPPMAKHYNSKLITDEQAKDLLQKGFLKETDFEILPGNDNLSDEELDLIIEISERLKNEETKKSIREHYKTVEKVGEKQLTTALLNSLIKEAESTL